MILSLEKIIYSNLFALRNLDTEIFGSFKIWVSNFWDLKNQTHKICALEKLIRFFISNFFRV